jgi:hypothetical protein
MLMLTVMLQGIIKIYSYWKLKSQHTSFMLESSIVGSAFDIYDHIWLIYIHQASWLIYIHQASWLKYIHQAGWLKYIHQAGWLKYIHQASWLKC